jgi:hypothetical protein
MRTPVAYVVTLLPAPDRDAVRDLRVLLKVARRHLHMRALSVREESIHRRDARRRIVTTPSVEKGKHPMTNLRKYGPANKFIKLEELQDRPPLRERIGLVKPELGKFGERLVLTFEPSGRMLSLNKTSVGNLLRDFGEDDSGWVGQLVEVYAGEVETQNGPADAILVRAADDVPDAKAKATKSAKAKPSTSSDMDDEIPSEGSED